MRLKLNVTDKGTSYEVVGINQNEGDTDYCEIVELYNIETFSKIAEAILDGKKVILPKLPNRDYDVSDVIIEDVDELSNAKNLYSVKIKDLVYGARINKVSLFDMFGYGLLSNWFADKGIFITDENREEKYMEVINMAAEMDNTETANQYVEKLTNMLDLRDKIEDTYGMYNIMNQYLASIDDAESVDEVKEIYDKALSEFR